MKISLCLALLFLSLTFFSCHRGSPPLKNEKKLRLAMESEPQTLDPRQARDLPAVCVIQNIYEGLMRASQEGLTPAIAKSYTLSEDGKTYTFSLRESFWSNGDLVTADDFEKSWKTLLDPTFPSPHAHQLYLVLGAKAVKEGREPLENVGIKAVDASTLEVTLEMPTSYFLQLTATYFLLPVHKSMRQNAMLQNKGQQPQGMRASPITNGPFMLSKWERQSEMQLKANPHYWDKSRVQLESIDYILLENQIALELFHRGEIDWIGSPLSTLSPDAIASLRHKEVMRSLPAAGLYFFRLNTEKPPFNHPKVRQAFAMALNRSQLVTFVLKGHQTPAFGLVPPSWLPHPPLFEEGHLATARQMLEEAREEEGWSATSFPRLTLHYPSNERAHKIAQVAQQQWQEAFSLPITLESNEAKVHGDLLTKGATQMALGSWFADFQDPLSFLEVFKFKNNGTNNTGWESAKFIALLDRSSQEEPAERIKSLIEAELLLVQEMPVIPLFYNSYNFVQNSHLQGVFFSEMGYLDLKQAYFK